jgi:hypothetical protein
MTGKVAPNSKSAVQAPKKSAAKASVRSRVRKKTTKPVEKSQGQPGSDVGLFPGARPGVEWIELFPNTMQVSTALGRPILIFKDRSGAEVLPVWMLPLDAGLVLAELSQGAGNSPHAVTRRVLQVAEMQLETCAFTEIVGHHQFVEMSFQTPKGIKTLRSRADESMSFCLQARAKFISTRSFMAQCRNLDADLAQLEQSLVQGQAPELLAEMEKSSKKHPFVM